MAASDGRWVIGVDFDNTIAGYDDLMHAIAVERGLIAPDSPRNKKAIRDALRALPDGESLWRGVQVEAYGPRMGAARLLDGVREFFTECRRRGITVYVVSHKTEFANFGDTNVNLREPALAWLEQHGFFSADGLGVARDAVFFESTRAEKVARIGSLGATHFIDDLEETFREPGFPVGVRRLLFDVNTEGDSPADHRFSTWTAIHHHLLGGDDATIAVLGAMLGKPVREIQRIGRGANSKVYTVRCHDGDQCVAKLYFQRTIDGLDRLDVEYSAMRFLWALGERRIPQPRLADRNASIALYEMVHGAPVDAATVSVADFEAVAAFAGSLRRIGREAATRFPHRAAEACFSFFQLEENIVARLDRLVAARGSGEDYADFDQFLANDLLPTARRVIDETRARMTAEEWTCELPMDRRTLSPSDFGFHNALRRPDGALVFLDFEYFGEDDPAKLIADFALHPAMALTDAQRRDVVALLLDEFGDDPELSRRFAVAYPLYALKWCTILLNEFVPTFLARREFAVGGGVDARQTRAVQLEKTRRLLRQIPTDTQTIAYADLRA